MQPLDFPCDGWSAASGGTVFEDISYEPKFIQRPSWPPWYVSYSSLAHAPLEPYISKQDTRWRQAVPSQTRVIAYLFHVTQGMTYNQISMILGIGVMTACKCIHACAYAICRHMFSVYIRLPTPPEARGNIEKWKQQTSIPGIFSVIDCTHIAIKKPCEHGQDYFNRKSHYSVNIQGSNLYLS